MTIRAQLFDGTILEFPEGTSPDVVAKTARAQTLALQKQTKPAAPKPVSSADSVRNQEVKDLKSSGGFFDRANDFLLQGRYNFEAGADRVVGNVLKGIGAGETGQSFIDAANRKKAVAETEIPDATTWEQVKGNPLLAPKFIAETGLSSLPGMAVVATGIGGAGIFAGSQAGNIGQTRAENNGRAEATGMDILKAAPAAVASAALERVGIKGITSGAGKTVAGRITKAEVAEGATEFGQSAIEYAGGTVGTDAGFDPAEAVDQAFAGAVGGAGVGGGIRGGAEIVDTTGRLIKNRTRRPVAPGATETAVSGVELTESDKASPLDNDLIMAGKVTTAQAAGNTAADSILRAAGMPETGKQVIVDLGDGNTAMGVVSDAFGEGDARGVTITMADGTVMKEHFDDLIDAGVSIRPVANSIEEMQAEADAIDATLSAMSSGAAPANPGLETGATSETTTIINGVQTKTRKGKGVPVDNAKDIVETMFPQARVTSSYRGPNHALSKKNPNSWHAKSRAAVDVAPIKGMTFDQFVQSFKDSGLTILEAINEVGKGKTKHATGDHWHIVLGKGGGIDAQPGGTPAGVAVAGIDSAAPVGVAGDSPIDFGDGPRIADPAALIQPIAARTEDRVDTVATATGREVGVRYAVVEASDLKPSNLADGRVNPNYPADRQPRDRTRAASQNQVQNIANNLKPYWLGRSVRPDDGAPIIAPNGVVESGNGRSIALQQVYEQGGEKADEYRRFVEGQGIDTTGMEQPVLVRIREDQFSPEEERAFAREANMPTALGMAPTEQAMADADALSPDLMAQYQGGDVDLASNANFVRQFMSQIMSPQEAAQMQASDGRPNKTAFVRIRNALLGQAYGNPQLVENVAESLDTNIAAIGGALTDVAGTWSQMVVAAKNGQIPASLDITANLNEAVGVIDKARREGMKVADIVNQRNMFTGESVDPVTEAVLRLFFAKPDFTKPAGRSRVVTALQEYVGQAMAQRLDQGSMLGAEPASEPSGLLGQARVKQGYEDGQTPSATEATAEPAAPARERAPQDGRDVERPDGESLPQDGEQQASGDVAPDLAGTAIDKEWVRFADDSGTLNIPRDDMPQIKAEHRGAMVNFLNARGIAHAEETVPAASLKPTQAEFSKKKVEKAKAYEGGDRAILISKDNHVVDGHHQWLAKRDQGEDVRTIRLDAPIRELLDIVPEFPSATTADGQPAAPVDKTPANSDSVAQAPAQPAKPQETVADVPGRPRVVINRVGKDGLTDAERAADIGKALQAKITADFDAARAEYAQIDGPLSGSSDGGRILNTDLARELSPEYRADRSRSAEVHEPASAFVKKLFAQMLTEPVPAGKTKTVLFTAGGTGAGKSTGMNLLPDNDTAGIVFDTNMNTRESAQQKVDQALEAGWAVTIQYTYRDPIEALKNGALPRAERMGRTVPLSAHIETHVGSRKTVAELAQRYAGNPRVLVFVADNSQGKGNAKLVPLENIPEVSDVGLYETAEKTVRAEFAAGRIAESTLRGTLASREERVRGTAQAEQQRDGPVDRGQPEPQRDGPSPVTPEPAADTRFSKNTLFTEDKIAAAKARMKERMNRLNSGVDPEMLIDGMVIAGGYIEAGVRNFAEFAKAMQADFGKGINPYLLSFWEGSRNYPGLNTEGMTAPDVSRAMSAMILADMSPVSTTNDNPATPPVENEDGLQGTLRQGDAGTGTADVPRTETDGGANAAPVAEEQGSAQAVRPTDGESGQATQRSGTRSDRDTGSRGTGDRAASGVSKLKGQNWSIAPGSLDENRGPSQKAKDNIKAIELIKELDKAGRMATAEEQAFIAKYVGWGGLKNAFPDTDGSYGKGFETVGPRLRELLTDDEYDTARRSIQYAHYTSEKVVRPMWELAARLGFNGGLVFEPGMGTGNFAGMMPAGLAARTQYQGLEYDKLTARIAHHLYPMWGTRQDDYTDTPRLTDAFDLVIGNPPFSGTVIKGDPYYGKFGFVLHDFFFAKSLDAVKPGGVLMFVTSAGTMNKLDAKAREYLADRAELLGAIRLPNDAFAANAGTRVTTDIIVLRKRAEGEAAGSRDWTETVNLELPNREGGTTTGAVNRYFAENPDMILGEQGMFDQLTAGERYGVRSKPGTDIEVALTEAIGRITTKPMTSTAAAPVQIETMAVDFNVNEQKEGSFYVAENGDLMRLQGGVGRQIQAPGKGVTGGISKDNQEKARELVTIRDALRTTIAADLKGDKAAADKARKSLNDVYDAFVGKHGPINKAEISFRRPNIIQQESARARAREDARTNGLEWNDGEFDDQAMIDAGMKMQERARARADAREAAEKSGRTFDEGSWKPDDMDDIVIVKRPNIDFFMSDQEGYRLRSIEHYNDDTGTAKKGIVFTENPIALETKPEINSVEDALLYVMNRHGKPILPEIARAADISEAEVLDRIGGALYEVPGTGEYETRELYLSGNVREKLDVARAAAQTNPEYARNVEALEAVQPAPLSQQDIAANLGMPWLPPEIIEQFGTEALGLSRLKVTYVPKLAKWSTDGDTSSAAAGSTWGTEDIQAPVLISNALNRVTPTVRRTGKNPDGSTKSEVDVVATQAAQDKMMAIKARFNEWVWEDEARTNRLTELYNREYNSRVAPKFDGSYLKTPGIASFWRWRPHQSAVVARIIQTGNTYMAHGVGAGKTSAMIGAGMEMKRLGLVNKPMYAVPNHMLGQFTKEFYEQYPSARIMVADETRFHTDRRKQFISDVANNDIDAVILTHSAFGLLPISPKFEAGMVEEQIADYRELLADLPKDQENRITRSRVEKQVEQLEQRLKALGNRKKDNVYTFEETGIDFMFVDEAHLFRKLAFTTKMAQVKGIDPDGSQASFDLYSKIRYLEGNKPGRSVVLASGTPITNTMAELFTVQRYMQGGELNKLDLGNFDAWAGSFGDTATRLEQDPAGNYKPVTRFAKFVNVPELSVMVRQFMDVVTSQELESLVVRPKLKDGKRNLVVVEQTPSQKAYQVELAARIKAIQARKGPPAKGQDILLSVINDGRKSAIDMRLIDRSAPKEDTKLEALISNVFRIWKESKRAGFHGVEGKGYTKDPVDYGPAAQMIFSGVGVNASENGISVHDYIRAQLMQRGIPAREIAMIGDYNNHVKKQRLFNDVNEGKVRILIGSEDKMGTGVNAQTRLIANHNLDAQWYPAKDEQRNGRIIRQGNMNPEVSISDYSTKGTYDSQMWQLMANKAGFIEGFMRGDPTMRDMEDIGEASQYEQAQALTTSDPRVMVLTEYRQSLDKALRQRDAFQREVAANKRAVVDANDQVRHSERRVKEITADIAQRIDVTGDKFTAKAGAVTFDKRELFGLDLLQQVDAIKARESVSGKPEKLGEMGGFPIYAEARSFAGEIRADIYVRFNGENDVAIKETDSATGLVSMIAQRLASLESQLEYNTRLISEARAKIDEYTPKLGATYTGAAEITDLREKIDALETELEGTTGGVDGTPENVEEAEAAELIAAIDALTFEALPERRDATDMLGGPTQAEKREALEREGSAPKRTEATQRPAGSDGGLFDTQGQNELFSIGGRAQEAATSAQKRALEKELTDRLTAIGISDRASVLVVNGLLNGTAVGRYRSGGMITISMAGRKKANYVLDHESIHAMRDMGLFTKAEWTMLSGRARSDKDLMKSIKRRYPDLNEEAQTEEAIADLFAGWSQKRRMPTAVDRIFNMIRNVLQAIGDVFGKRGNDADAVLAAIESGEIGSRPTADNSDYNAAAGVDVKYARATPPQAMVSLAGTDPTWKGKMADRFERFRMVTQDRYITLRKTQRKIERAFGRPIPDNMDVYKGEELVHGRIAERLDRLQDKVVRPILDAMAAAQITIDEFESYLYARHAPERNAQIAKINDDMPDGGSGMTNVQARAIMARVAASPKYADFKRLAKRVDDLREMTIDNQVEYGLISDDLAQSLRDTYKYYVPLRGFKEMDSPTTPDRPNKSGGGINVRGPEFKRAFGRRSEADSPLSYLIMQAEEAISRGETNRVAQEFYALAKASPDPDFWKVAKVQYKRRINPDSGKVEDYLVTPLTAEDAPYTVIAKIDGKEKRVTMNKENPQAARLADAMRRLSDSQLDWITKNIGVVNRWLSAVNTRFNPEFVITNLFRDLQTTAINLQGIDVDALTRRTAGHYAGAMAASMRGSFDKGKGDWGKWYDEFVLAGAKTAFARIDDIESVKSNIEKEFAAANSRAGNDKSVLLKLRRAGSAAKDLVENVNDGVENSIRLAVYRASRESGLSEKQAASIAKNITVNFNRRGQMGPAMNALYLFYNASVQGNVRILQALYHSKKVRGIVAGVAIAGLASELLNALVSDDDDDGESFYDKIPAFEKERNIIIMHPDGKGYTKIPMPWGYNVFWETGRIVAEVTRRGGDRAAQSGLQLLTTYLGAFNPVGFSWEGRSAQEIMVSAIMPTPIDPIVDLSQNVDFSGKPIMPEESQFGPQDPDAQRFWPGVDKKWKAVTDAMTEATGGDVVQAGNLDVSPETIEYLVNTMFGAVGGFVDRVVSLPEKMLTGEATINDFPMVRKVVGKKSPYADKSAFFERMKEVEARVDDGKDYLGAEMMEEFDTFVKDHEAVLSLEPIAKEARKASRQIRKERRGNDAALDKGTITAAEHKANDKILDEVEQNVVTNFNRAWVSTVYKGEQ